jgi:hypothetical protein
MGIDVPNGQFFCEFLICPEVPLIATGRRGPLAVGIASLTPDTPTARKRPAAARKPTNAKLRMDCGLRASTTLR